MLDDDALSIGFHVAGSVINQVSLHGQVLVSQHPKIRGWLDKKLKDEALVTCARRGALRKGQVGSARPPSFISGQLGI